MGADPPPNRVIGAYLDDVAEELAAFDALFAARTGSPRSTSSRPPRS